MAVTNGTSASVLSAPHVADQSTALIPSVQTQDGSFVGYIEDYPSQMIAFDANGNVRWIVPGYRPQIATEDGGVIATADSGGTAVFFDSNGSATKQMAKLIIQSWTGKSYEYGSTRQIFALAYYLAASGWALNGGQYTRGTAGPPVDSRSDDNARSILTPALWQRFAQSNCGKVFSNSTLGLAPMVAGYDSTMRAAQVRQRELRFYDVGTHGALTLQAVTAGVLRIPVAIVDRLGPNNAEVPLPGRPGPVLLKAGFFGQSLPAKKFTLVHEVFLHAYAGQNDDAIYGNSHFAAKGLWRPSGSTATHTITTWMSTDCKCTPEQSPSTCPANTATW